MLVLGLPSRRPPRAPPPPASRCTAKMMIFALTTTHKEEPQEMVDRCLNFELIYCPKEPFEEYAHFFFFGRCLVPILLSDFFSPKSYNTDMSP